MPSDDRTYRPWRERLAVALHLIERRDRQPSSVVVVASTPRTGSTLLCRTLNRTGVVGELHEALNNRSLLRAARRWGAPKARPWSLAAHAWRRRRMEDFSDWYPFSRRSLRRYLFVVGRRRQTPNGVFAFKVHGLQFQKTLHRHGIDLHQWGVPVTWLRIRRRDRVAQAVSNARALQTTQFIHTQTTRGAAKYDAELIADCLEQNTLGEAFWDEYLPANGITPIEVWYEDLAADPTGEFRRVLDALGHPDAEVPVPATERQGDSLNREWIERFRRERPDLVAALETPR